MISRRTKIAASFLATALVLTALFVGARTGWLHTPGPPIAFLRDVHGEVDQRVHETAWWHGALAGGTLSAGYELSTRQLSRSVVILRGAGRLILSPESHVRLNEPEFSPGGKLKAMRLELLSGSVRVESAVDAEAQIELVTRDRRLGVERGGTLLAAYQAKSGEFLLSFLDADGFFIEGTGDRKVVPRDTGVRVTQSKAVASISLPAPPTTDELLTDPELYTGSLAAIRPTFQFTDNATTKRVVVSRDRELTNIVVDVSGSGPITAPQPLNPGEYFWAAATVAPEHGLTGPFSKASPLTIRKGDAPKPEDKAPDAFLVASVNSEPIIYYSRQAPTVDLDWVGLSSRLGYRVIVARDKGFRLPVVDAKTKESRFQTPALTVGQYWWKAEGQSGVVVGSFRVKEQARTETSDKDLYPVDERFSPTQVSYQRTRPNLELKWTPDSEGRASSYEVTVSRNRDFSQIIFKTKTDKTRVTTPGSLFRDGTYFWRVARILPDGETLFPGARREIAFRFNNTSSGIEISEPAINEIVTADTVTVSGIAVPGMTLTANGVKVAVGRDGRFAQSVPIAAGTPSVVIKSERAGKISYHVRTLRQSIAVN